LILTPESLALNRGDDISPIRPVADRPGPVARDEPSQRYMERRTQEGLSKREIIRCLKRFVARLPRPCARP
jgi:hypothetical protein